MASSNSQTFGYMKAWAKGFLDRMLKEYEADGILLSGKVQLKETQVDELIRYLQDPANMGQYGVDLDFALFYKEEDKVQISGKLSTPYVKDGNTNANTNTTTRAKRTM